MEKNTDKTLAVETAGNKARRLQGGIWDALRAQAKNAERELLKLDGYGKGEGERRCLIHPRGIYAEVLDKPLFQ